MESKERKALINQLEWNSGGFGYGVCSFGNQMIWEMDRPGPNKPDLKSVVAVCGNPKKYTTEELTKIVEFSKFATARYDELFTIRRGCNLILFDKRDDGHWMRKRLSWTMGPMYSPSLDEALTIMNYLK